MIHFYIRKSSLTSIYTTVITVVLLQQVNRDQAKSDIAESISIHKLNIVHSNDLNEYSHTALTKTFNTPLFINFTVMLLNSSHLGVLGGGGGGGDSSIVFNFHSGLFFFYTLLVACQELCLFILLRMLVFRLTK